MAVTQQASNRRLLLAYAESSKALAAPLERAFAAAGFDVRVAPAGQAEADAAIDEAALVVVCWTPAAVASDVVTLRAERARRARKLVSVLLAPSSPPSSFGGRFGVVDLTGWRGDAADRVFLHLVHSLNARLAGRVLSGGFWHSRIVSWGGAGAGALAILTLVINFGGLRQAVDSVLNPAASEAALTATDAKVEEVLTLLKQKSAQPLSADAEAALRESIERLLSAQSGARGSAASKLAKGDIDGALADLKGAADEGEKAAAGLSETWQEIGALAYSGRTFDAIEAYERAVQLSPKNEIARNQLGNLYIRAGRLDQAQEQFDTINQTTDDEFMTAVAQGNLGVIAMARGDDKGAEEHFTWSLESNEKLKNLDGQAGDLGDLGEIYRMRDNFDEAEKKFRRSLALYEQSKNEEGQAVAHARIGAVARDRGRNSAAIAEFQTALDISTRIDDPESQAFALRGLADVALNTGKLEDAKKYYNDALAAARKVDASEPEANALVGLGSVAEKLGDKVEAIERFRDAMLIYRQMGIDSEVTRLQARMKRNGAVPSDEGPEN